jgi:hypothetical protein
MQCVSCMYGYVWPYNIIHLCTSCNTWFLSRFDACCRRTIESEAATNVNNNLAKLEKDSADVQSIEDEMGRVRGAMDASLVALGKATQGYSRSRERLKAEQVVVTAWLDKYTSFARFPAEHPLRKFCRWYNDVSTAVHKSAKGQPGYVHALWGTPGALLTSHAFSKTKVDFLASSPVDRAEYEKWMHSHGRDTFGEWAPSTKHFTLCICTTSITYNACSIELIDTTCRHNLATVGVNSGQRALC